MPSGNLLESKMKLRLQGALIRLLQTKELTNITVKRLCDEAQIHRTTFYNHYENISDVFADIKTKVIIQCEKFIVRRHKLLQLSNKQQILDFYTEFLLIVQKYESVMRILLSDSSIGKFKHDLLVAAQKLDSNVKLYYEKVYIIGGMFDVIRYWLDDCQSVPISELSLNLFEIGTLGRHCDF
ncbi:TetR/AcrR family transcriptional regulator [Bombilactobacillus thymidiniphilus]|uniref:TetR/AcrR family transcriptional regulator n=1 Tax=Bombilactobacillus thymidiniphilus TaxID=2923363 RepID=A0ABY4PEP0_9LACO|nr:TetR/AcrR family transcriptional regulator [Bombilactobacillus thymidiniphilus]UQS84200.1 TetR/AcrR family transcriptional regulator [Bombilactobacillus thymidiniphilus]